MSARNLLDFRPAWQETSTRISALWEISAVNTRTGQECMSTWLATVFAHALFGGINAGGHISDSAFAMGFGGGLDVNVNDHFAVRAVQFDWIPIQNAGAWDTNTIRFGFGIVIK
jgi:opacity protein-like surface antigen